MRSAPLIPADLLAAYNHRCLPAGAVRADSWQAADRPYRSIFTADRRLDAADVVDVWGHAIQFSGGSIDVDGVVDAPRVMAEIGGISVDLGTTAQVREFVRVCMAVADELDSWGADDGSDG